MTKRKILWDKQALHYFRNTIQYIRKDSPQNADKVKREILEKIDELSVHPEIHNPTNTRWITTRITERLNCTG